MSQRRIAASWLLVIAACSSSEPSRPGMVIAGSGGASASGSGGVPPAAVSGAPGPAPSGGRSGSPSELDEDASVASCAKAEYEATFRPLDLLVLLDQSGSMTEDDDRWTPTTNAIKTFVGARESEGIGIGLQYFPLGDDDDVKCQGATYAKPDVPVAALPGNAQAMVSSIDAHYFTKENCCDGGHDGTPTRPAIEGVFAYLREWLQMHPERDGAVLLATDGEPSSVCDDNEIEDVSRVIREAAEGKPSLKTYVIGIGEEDSLGELAEAGGTGQGAFVVDGSGMQTEMQLLETFGKIRGETLRCDFDVPSGMNSDPTNVNVERTTGGATTTLVKVPEPSACSRATAGGWYYDGASKRIQLCPDVCREVLAAPLAKVNIVVGCAAVLL